MILHCSLALVKAASSCPEGVQRTHTNLFDFHRGDEQAIFSLIDVLERSGLDDAVWALRAVPPSEHGMAEWVGRNFAADCVGRATEEVKLERDEEEWVASATRLARRAAFGEAGPTELAWLWRSTCLPSRGGPSGWILRAARACIFPGGVSEAARHAAVCAVRATPREEAAVRRWQAARLWEWLHGRGTPNQTSHQPAERVNTAPLLSLAPTD